MYSLAFSTRVLVAVACEIADRSGTSRLAQIAGSAGIGAFQIAHGVHHPLCRLGIGGARGLAVDDPGGRTTVTSPFTPSSTATTEGRSIIASGRPSRSGFTSGQMFDQPDHVIAKIAKQPGSGLGQVVGQVDRLSAISARRASSGLPVGILKRLAS